MLYLRYWQLPGICRDLDLRISQELTLSQSRSRGINENIFKTYDYILVFVGREYASLQQFREVLVSSKGKEMNGKARVLHLGAYLGKPSKTVEITDAAKEKDGLQSRANWNKTTSQIKVSKLSSTPPSCRH